MAVAVGVRAAPAPGLAWARVLEEQSGRDMGRGRERGGKDRRELQFPAAHAAPPEARGLLGAVVLRACSRACARLNSCPALAGL